MGIFTAVQNFESRHPAVQHLLSLFSVNHLSETERIATKFEDLASHLAGLLPDGQAIQDVLTLLGDVQQRALVAVAEMEGATPEQLAALANNLTVTQATQVGGGYVITPAAPVDPRMSQTPAGTPVVLDLAAARLDAQAAAAAPVAAPMAGQSHPVWWPSPDGPGDAQLIADASAVDNTTPAAPVAQAPAQAADAPILPTLGQRLAALSNTLPASGAGGTGTGDSGPMGAGHAADATAGA